MRDVDLGLRLQLNGWKAAYVPEARGASRHWHDQLKNEGLYHLSNHEELAAPDI